MLKTKSFSRWARKEGVRDKALLEAAEEMRHGLVDAQLGGGLVKKRVARAGGGKRGGYRVLAATDLRLRCVFLFGFAKSERDDLDDKELAGLKRLAHAYLGLDEDAVERALALGQLVEVEGGESKTA
ncbi:MAG: type II toxin-antitoxin system RelE/ParE family toxin [Burkholderiales bacterium]